MDELILKTKFDDVSEDDFRNFLNLLSKYSANDIKDDIAKIMRAFGKQIIAYHPRRESQGELQFGYVWNKIKEVFNYIELNNEFYDLMYELMKSTMASGWTQTNVVLLRRYFFSQDYIKSRTPDQLREYVMFLANTDFSTSKFETADSVRGMKEERESFIRQMFFDIIPYDMSKAHVDIYQDFLKNCYLKAWNNGGENIDTYLFLATSIKKKFQKIYKDNMDMLIVHFSEISAKIITEPIPTDEGRKLIQNLFHFYDIIDEIAAPPKLVHLWLKTLFDLYKVKEDWMNECFQNLIRQIRIIAYGKSSKTAFKESIDLFNDVVEYLISVSKVKPNSDQKSRQEWFDSISIISVEVISHILKDANQLELLIPFLLTMMEDVSRETNDFLNSFYRKHNAKFEKFVKSKPEALIPLIKKLLDVSILARQSSDLNPTPIEEDDDDDEATYNRLYFTTSIRTLRDAFETITEIIKKTEASKSKEIQECFRETFLTAFTKYSITVSIFITQFVEYISVENYSSEQMYEFLKNLNTVLENEEFKKYNDFNIMSINKIFVKICDFLKISFTTYKSSIDELCNTVRMCFKLNFRSLYNGVMYDSVSAYTINHIFFSFLSNKTNDEIAVKFFPLLLEALEMTYDVKGVCENFSGCLSALPFHMEKPSLLAPNIPKLISLMKQNLNRITMEEQLINVVKAISDGNSSVLNEYVSTLEEVLIASDAKQSIFLNLPLLFFWIYTNNPELISKRLVDAIFAKGLGSDYSLFYSPQLLVTISKFRPDYVKPYFNDIVQCMKTYKIRVEKPLSNTFTNLLEQDMKLGEQIFPLYAELINENITDFSFGVTLLVSLRQLGLLRHDLLVLLKGNIESWQKQNPAFHDSCQHLLDVIADRSLAGLETELNEQKQNIVEIDDRLDTQEDKVKDIEKAVEQHDEGLVAVNERIDQTNEEVAEVKKDIVELGEQVEEIDLKTISNAPKWSREVSKLLNPESDADWKLLASRLGFSVDDVRTWSTHADPCMSMLSDWFAVRRHVEATKAILEQLIEMNRLDASEIVENALTAAEAAIADEDPIEFTEPPTVFLSYQWAVQEEVKILRDHLRKAGYRCWMDIGQMGGGDKLYESIDRGIRGAKVFVSCVTEKYSQSPNCKRELNLAISLKKSVIPLQMERMDWPPPGTMGPLLTEYIFIRMFNKPGTPLVSGTFWPKDRFQELLKQIRYSCAPEYEIIDDSYANWWGPPEEISEYHSKVDKSGEASNKGNGNNITVLTSSPDIFLSYQWGKQSEVKALHSFLSKSGYTCWMDIYQMGGGDSLYDKIDRGIRNCKVMVSCVTSKYAESINCRKEVSLCDSLKKPLIPLLLERMQWPPEGPMSMILTQLVYISFVENPEEQHKWNGPSARELLKRISPFVSNKVVAVDEKRNNRQSLKVNDKIVKASSGNSTNGKQMKLIPSNSPGGVNSVKSNSTVLNSNKVVVANKDDNKKAVKINDKLLAKPSPGNYSDEKQRKPVNVSISSNSQGKIYGGKSNATFLKSKDVRMSNNEKRSSKK